MDKKVLFEALNTELAKENIDLEIQRIWFSTRPFIDIGSI